MLQQRRASQLSQQAFSPPTSPMPAEAATPERGSVATRAKRLSAAPSPSADRRKKSPLRASAATQGGDLAAKVDRLARMLNSEQQARVKLEREVRSSGLRQATERASAIAELQRAMHAQQQQIDALRSQVSLVSQVAQQQELRAATSSSLMDPDRAFAGSGSARVDEARLLERWAAEYERLVKANVEQHAVELRTMLVDEGERAGDRLELLVLGVRDDVANDRDKVKQDVEKVLAEKDAQLLKQKAVWKQERKVLLNKVVELDAQVAALRREGEEVGATGAERQAVQQQMSRDIATLAQTADAVQQEQETAAREIASLAAAQMQTAEAVQSEHETSREIASLLRQEIFTVREEAQLAAHTLQDSMRHIADDLTAKLQHSAQRASPRNVVADLGTRPQAARVPSAVPLPAALVVGDGRQRTVGFAPELSASAATEGVMPAIRRPRQQSLLKGMLEMEKKKTQKTAIGAGRQHVNADLHETLRRVPFAHHLEVAELEALAQEATRVTVRRGEDFVRQGDTSDSLYIVEAGEVQASIDGVGVVRTYHMGDFFGESFLTPGAVRAATVGVPANAEIETASCLRIRSDHVGASIRGQIGLAAAKAAKRYRMDVTVFTALVPDGSGLLSADEFAELAPMLRKNVAKDTDSRAALDALEQIVEDSDGLLLGKRNHSTPVAACVLALCKTALCKAIWPLTHSRTHWLFVSRLCVCAEEFSAWWMEFPNEREAVFKSALEAISTERESQAYVAQRLIDRHLANPHHLDDLAHHDAADYTGAAAR